MGIQAARKIISCAAAAAAEAEAGAATRSRQIMISERRGDGGREKARKLGE